MWMNKGSKGKKRARVMEESDEDDGQISLPSIILGKGSSTSIYSHFNHVYFNDDITFDTAFALNKELRDAETKIKTTAAALGVAPMPIFLHITSHGGAVHAAFSVVDCISQLSVKVYTVAEGFVASAATLITLAGEKRFITPNAYMLIHELRSGVWGKMTSIEEEFVNLKKIMDHITGFYTGRTNITKKSLEKILTKDLIWNAEESIEKGLVHEVYISAR
jgi:ATP-dependent protease ClpP protease subunit